MFHPILSAVSMSLKSSVSSSLEQTGLTHLFTFLKVGRVDFKTLKRGSPVKGTCSQTWKYEFDSWSLHRRRKEELG